MLRAPITDAIDLDRLILAFAVFRGAKLLRLTHTDFSMLETNSMGSVASAAGYMTGGGNMAAYPALLMLTAVRPDSFSMFAWFAVIAALGLFVAIPVKRQLINREQLALPTGTATAETLRSLHEGTHAETKTAGSGDKAKLLGYAGLVGALLAFGRDAKAGWIPFNIPGAIPLPFEIAGRAAKDWTLTLKSELITFGAGALMSFRTGWSLVLGGVLTYAVLAPSLVAEGLVATVSYNAIVAWTLWPGAAMLLTSGLTSFLLDWRSVSRSFAGLARLFRKHQAIKADPIAEVECPDAWFPIDFAVLGPIIVYLMSSLFGIPWQAGVVAVPLAGIMGFSAER